MATPPTLQDAERHLLNIFEKFGTRPGDNLRAVSIMTNTDYRRFTADELNAALASMYEKGWIKNGQMPDSFELTADGFAAI